MNDCITTTKQSTTKPCAYFLGYTVCSSRNTTKHNTAMYIYTGHSAFPISRGHFSPHNSRTTHIARSLGPGRGVFREFEVWPKLYLQSCCDVCNFMLYYTAIYQEFIVSPAGLTHWGRDKMDAISQTPFSSAFSWMKISEFRLKVHWSLFPRVQLTIFLHWFR